MGHFSTKKKWEGCIPGYLPLKPKEQQNNATWCVCAQVSARVPYDVIDSFICSFFHSFNTHYILGTLGKSVPDS